jgi:hypothetical protein
MLRLVESRLVRVKGPLGDCTPIQILLLQKSPKKYAPCRAGRPAPR